MVAGFARRRWLRAVVLGSALAWGLGGARAVAQTDGFFGVATAYGGYSAGGYAPSSYSYNSHGGLYSPATASYRGVIGGYGGSYYSMAGHSYGSSAYYPGMHAGSGYFFGHGYVGPSVSYGGSYYSPASRYTPPLARGVGPYGTSPAPPRLGPPAGWRKPWRR